MALFPLTFCAARLLVIVLLWPLQDDLYFIHYFNLVTGSYHSDTTDNIYHTKIAYQWRLFVTTAYSSNQAFSNPPPILFSKFGVTAYAQLLWLPVFLADFMLPQGEPRCGELLEHDIDDWVSQKGRFAPPASANGTSSTEGVRLIFGPSKHDRDGYKLPWTGLRKASEVAIPFSPKAFDSLVRRCKLPQQILEAHAQYTTAGFCSRFTAIDGTDGKIGSTSFFGMIRLLCSDTCFLAYNYDESTRITTGLILQASQKEKDEIQMSLVYHRSCLGQELLIPISFVNITLHGNAEHHCAVKQRVFAVERMTDQHTWEGQVSNVNRTSDEELSKSTHGLTIEVGVARRRSAVVSLWINVLLGTFQKTDIELLQTPRPAHVRESHSLKQWIEALDVQNKMQKLDVEYLERRVTNQTAAVYSLFSQRDNLANLSAAVESKKVAEAAKRDSSAIKSIAILTAIFFPGTFVAAVFSLESIKAAPFWLYWVITIPSTIATLGSWGLYTRHQSRLIETRELELDRFK